MTINLLYFLTYFATAPIIWFEYFRVHEKRNSFKAFLAMFLIPLIFSGVVEVCQNELTEYRSGDLFDFLFNMAGILFSNIICLTLLKYLFGKIENNRNKNMATEK